MREYKFTLNQGVYQIVITSQYDVIVTINNQILQKYEHSSKDEADVTFNTVKDTFKDLLHITSNNKLS